MFAEAEEECQGTILALVFDLKQLFIIKFQNKGTSLTYTHVDRKITLLAGQINSTKYSVDHGHRLKKQYLQRLAKGYFYSYEKDTILLYLCPRENRLRWVVPVCEHLFCFACLIKNITVRICVVNYTRWTCFLRVWLTSTAAPNHWWLLSSVRTSVWNWQLLVQEPSVQQILAVWRNIK